MAQDNQKLLDLVGNLTTRISRLEQDKINYQMPHDIRDNVQRAVIAGTQYLGNLSGIVPTINESTPSFLQFNYNGKLWNVPINAPITSGSGAPTFDAPEGSLYLRTDTGTIYINTNGAATWSSVTSSTLPTGTITAFGGSSAPTGTPLCDGTGYSTTTYAPLFAIIGYTYGGGGGTFNVPDMRGNVPAGYKSGDVYFGTLGLAVGEQKHTLNTNELPNNYYLSPAGGTVANYIGSLTQVQGGGAGHNNVQPSLTVNFVIKT